MPGSVEVPIEKWSGTIREITLGATTAEGGTRIKPPRSAARTPCPSWGLRASCRIDR